MIDTPFTPITTLEASNILNIKRGTIQTAMWRGFLTKIPSKTKESILIKEQVELFINKSQIRLTLLSTEELIKWKEYNDIVVNSSTIVNSNQEELIRTIVKEVTQEVFFYLINHSQEINDQNIELYEKIKELATNYIKKHSLVEKV